LLSTRLLWSHDLDCSGVQTYDPHFIFVCASINSFINNYIFLDVKKYVDNTCMFIFWCSKKIIKVRFNRYVNTFILYLLTYIILDFFFYSYLEPFLSKKSCWKNMYIHFFSWKIKIQPNAGKITNLSRKNK
jgi:hypothetical protein